MTMERQREEFAVSLRKENKRVKLKEKRVKVGETKRRGESISIGGPEEILERVSYS